MNDLIALLLKEEITEEEFYARAEELGISQQAADDVLMEDLWETYH